MSTVSFTNPPSPHSPGGAGQLQTSSSAEGNKSAAQSYSLLKDSFNYSATTLPPLGSRLP